MQGKVLMETEDKENADRGVQLRVFDEIFTRLREETSSQEPGSFAFLVKCSYMEIYNEQIMDLLNPISSNLQIREDFQRGVFVEGLSEEPVFCSEEAVFLLRKGAKNRHIGATNMNSESSRSHSIFTLACETRSSQGGMISVKVAKFNFVDLAGSERQKQTAATGERLKEATNINKSLTVLGSVINSLVEMSEGKTPYVRFRDSKLTFLLKDSLGGNAKTIMIANVSPASTNFHETLSTLKFAQRAKRIKNKASINEESSGSLETLKNEILRLKNELNLSQNRLMSLEKERQQATFNVLEIGYNKMKAEPISKEEDLLNFEELQLESTLDLKKYLANQVSLHEIVKVGVEIITEAEWSMLQEFASKEDEIFKLQEALRVYKEREVHLRMLVALFRKPADPKKDEWAVLRSENELLFQALGDSPLIADVVAENIRMAEEIKELRMRGEIPDESEKKSILPCLYEGLLAMEMLGKKLEEEGRNRKEFLREICLKAAPKDIGLAEMFEEEIEEAEKRLNDLNVDLFTLKRREKTLENEATQAKRQKNELAKGLEALREISLSNKESYEKRISDLKQESFHANSNKRKDILISVEEQVKETRALLAEAMDQAAAFRTESQQAKAEAEELWSQIELVSAEKSDLQREMDLLRIQFDEWNNKSKKAKEMIEKTLSKNKVSLKAANERISFLQEQLKRQEESMMQSQLANKGLQNEKEKNEQDLLEKLRALREELSHNKEKLEAEKMRHSESRSERVRLQEELETLQQSYSFISEELAAKRQLISSYLSQLEEEKKTKQELQEKFENEPKKSDSSLSVVENASKNTTIRENMQLKREMNGLQEAKETAMNEIESLRGEVNQLMKKMKATLASEQSGRKALVQMKIEHQSSVSRCAELQTMNTKKALELAEKSESLQKAQEEIKRLQIEIEELKKHQKDFKTEPKKQKYKSQLEMNEGYWNTKKCLEQKGRILDKKEFVSFNNNLKIGENVDYFYREPAHTEFNERKPIRNGEKYMRREELSSNYGNPIPGEKKNRRLEAEAWLNRRELLKENQSNAIKEPKSHYIDSKTYFPLQNSNDQRREIRNETNASNMIQLVGPKRTTNLTNQQAWPKARTMEVIAIDSDTISMQMKTQGLSILKKVKTGSEYF